MARNFYYGSDETMASGSALFNAGISADPESFGISTALAAEYAQIDATLQAAMLAATTPATRTTITVSEKNAAVKAMQRGAKRLADIARSTPTVTDAQLISIGLLPRPVRTRRHAPDTPPAVRVLSVVGRAVTIRVCEANSASGRAKAFGARGSEIFVYIGEAPPADASDYRFECFSSRTTTTLTFANSVPSGATAWVSARWVTARGETSIGSSPIAITVQGGAITAGSSNALRAAA